MTSVSDPEAIENMVNAIWANAKRDGRLLYQKEKKTIPLAWFSKYVQENLMIDDTDIERRQILTNFCRKKSHSRVDRTKVINFFKSISTTHSLSRSVHELEATSDASTADQSSADNSADDSGRDSRLSQLKPSDSKEVIYENSSPDSAGDRTFEIEHPTAHSTILESNLHCNDLIVSISEEEIRKYQEQLVEARKQIAVQTGIISSLRDSLEDAYTKHEDLIASFQKSKFDDESKIIDLQENLLDQDARRNSLTIELVQAKRGHETAQIEIEKQIEDYKTELTQADEEISALKVQAVIYEDKIREVTREQAISRLYEEETISPTKELQEALKKCKVRDREVGRLNKSDSDLTWWPDSSKPKPLLLRQVDPGECLAEFIPPEYIPDVSTPAETHNDVFRTYRKRFVIAVFTNLVLFCALLYLCLVYFKDDLQRLGILTITYDPIFYSQL